MYNIVFTHYKILKPVKPVVQVTIISFIEITGHEKHALLSVKYKK